MFSDDKKVIIVFNGEVYNFQTLKKELEDIGENFTTTSDTEVVLKMYLKYGVKSFSKLDGMFAFSIYDKKKNTIFIARDYFGEKPLYYTTINDNFIWASELKSIKSQIKKPLEISKTGLELYFTLTYIPAPYTIYDKIKKLEANKYIEYNIDNKEINIHPIVLNSNKLKTTNFDKAKSITKQLVEESVINRSISDVPLGTFLSGGVDSSIVTYCLAKNKEQKIDTFSIGFDKKIFDETEKSRVVAKLVNSNHHEFIVNEKKLSDEITKILNNFDEPFADASALPTYIVSRETSNYVKVALTGDGGDEVFGGYNKYLINNINKKYTRLIPESLHKQINKLSHRVLKTKDDNRGQRFKIKKTLNSIDYKSKFLLEYNIIGF